MAVPHDLPLVSTVAAGLSLAFLFGMIASRLRIPPIVGYLFAGIMIGPYTPGFIGDVAIAEQLAEIGIVLLMFGVGLHFSLDDLKEVRKIALPGAVVQIGAAMAMSVAITMYFWDWSLQAGLMFGLALSVASTVVLLRSLEEHNLLQSINGRIAIGWLIVEDLFVVLALVLIPALAGVDDVQTSVQASPVYDFAMAIAKIAAFVALMLIGGKRALPWLLTLVAKTRSRELFTLAVFAVTVGLAFFSAQLFGVSLALGAFFAGMMIRESDLNHEVAERALPFQDAFAVLFFVAVGMLFNPSILVEEPLKVLLTVGIIMVGKSAAAFMIVTLFRYPLKTGLLVSAGLAQIGEFSFILAALGVSYGLLPEDGRNLILAGAIISIALNPITFYGSRIMYECAGRFPGLSRFFDMHDDDLTHLSQDERSHLRELVILVGHGRIGQHISRNITAAHIDLVVIDSNREVIDALRERGYHAIAGDASRAETLREAAIDKAVAVVVAVADPFEARRIVDTARSLSQNIRVIAHAHNDDEMAYFKEQNVDLTVTGADEVARRMVDYLHAMKRA